jgi:hypothetical protein
MLYLVRIQDVRCDKDDIDTADNYTRFCKNVNYVCHLVTGMFLLFRRYYGKVYL